MGMTTMRERATAAGLALRIASTLGEGTAVIVEGSVTGS
jgi:signal transduction histidine kinase